MDQAQGFTEKKGFKVGREGRDHRFVPGVMTCLAKPPSHGCFFPRLCLTFATFPAYERPVRIVPLFLGILLCTVLLLGAGLYYSSTRRDFKVLEEFHSQLAIVFLQMKQAAMKCWTWLTRQ